MQRFDGIPPRRVTDENMGHGGGDTCARFIDVLAAAPDSRATASRSPLA
jgi:hypothetical protein